MKAKRAATSWVTWLTTLSAVAVILPALIEAEYPDVSWLGTVRIAAAIVVVAVGKLTYDRSTTANLAKHPTATINVPLVPAAPLPHDET